jgi:hypothetical protein
MLWKILKIIGVPDNLIEELKNVYTDVTINLRVGEKLVQFLSTRFRQGDNLTPILFIFVNFLAVVFYSMELLTAINQLL